MDSYQLRRKYLPIILAVLITSLVVGYYYYENIYIKQVPIGGSSLTEKQKLDILDQMLKSSSSTLTVGQQRKILQNLSQTSSSSYQYSDEGKIQILDAMMKQTKN